MTLASGAFTVMGVLWSDEMKQFVNELLGRLFHLPSSEVGYHAVVVMSAVLFVFFLTISAHSSYEWIRHGMKRSGLPFQRFVTGLSGRHGDTFLVGETVRLEARFIGELENGFFTCLVDSPDHKILPDTNTDHVWWVDYNTNDWKVDTGRLHGRGSSRLLRILRAHKSVWGHKIPLGYPDGEYAASVMVYDDKPERTLLDSRKTTFKVVGENILPLRGGGGFVEAPTFH
jgi:hypothetical protein